MNHKIVEDTRLSELGKMAGSIAHEINNPLSVIRMNAEILLEYCENSSESKKILDKCRKIITTADRITGIIRALKSISASAAKPAFRWTRLSEVIDDIADLSEPRFKLASIPLYINLEAIKNQEFYIDSAQISQATINLLNNAFDAIQECPEKWVKLQGEVRNGMLRLVIIDSGKGIPEDILKHILNPFFSTKEKHNGLGIGLHLVQSYAAFHDGTLNYDLVDGHTSFTLEFPLRKIQPTREVG